MKENTFQKQKEAKAPENRLSLQNACVGSIGDISTKLEGVYVGEKFYLWAEDWADDDSDMGEAVEDDSGVAVGGNMALEQSLTVRAADVLSEPTEVVRSQLLSVGPQTLIPSSAMLGLDILQTGAPQVTCSPRSSVESVPPTVLPADGKWTENELVWPQYSSDGLQNFMSALPRYGLGVLQMGASEVVSKIDG